MENLNELKEYGESLGYKDEELRTFVREQQATMLDERAAIRDREKEKDGMNFKLEMESKALERERQENEYKLHKQH